MSRFQINLYAVSKAGSEFFSVHFAAPNKCHSAQKKKKIPLRISSLNDCDQIRSLLSRVMKTSNEDIAKFAETWEIVLKEL